MPKVPETFQVEANTRAAGKALAAFVVEFKAALKLGNTFAEALAVTSALLKDVAPLLALVPAIEGEFADDPYAQVITIAACGVDIAKAVTS